MSRREDGTDRFLWSYIRDLNVQPDGRIVVCGSIQQADFPVARYTVDVSLDPSFDEDGVTTVDFSAGFAEARALDLLDGGKILVAGTASEPDGGFDFALARGQDESPGGTTWLSVPLMRRAGP
ncbi:MAG TPA: delta-60 repeat domain-containing protein [Ardenticatenaceae bacterium]|nr:delta-60 repeat domain-containing protein [Ardenticatenaceae bacterium]